VPEPQNPAGPATAAGGSANQQSGRDGVRGEAAPEPEDVPVLPIATVSQALPSLGPEEQPKP
jgi:hypothetical protein